VAAEIEISGGTAFQHRLSQLARKVQRGKIVRVIHLSTGVHRAWFTRERPGGCEPVRVTVGELQRALGRIFDDVRGGQVIEVYDARSGQTRGYLYWAAGDWLTAVLQMPLTYSFTSKSGRVITRPFHPLAVTAERSPRDRDAEALWRLQRRGVLA
jgi:hypothetical protein